MQALSVKASENPKQFMWLAALLSIAMIFAVALPSLWPKPFAEILYPLNVDTDPENMLDKDEPVRIFHNKMKKEFSLNDIIVVGVVNKSHKQGAFNAQTLRNVHELTEYAKTIQWENKDGRLDGVIEVDLLAPSTVDNIEQGGPGVVKFEWLMSAPPVKIDKAVQYSLSSRFGAAVFAVQFIRELLMSKRLITTAVMMIRGMIR